MSGGEGQKDDANSDKRSLASTPVSKMDWKSTEGAVFFVFFLLIGRHLSANSTPFLEVNNVAEQAHGQLKGFWLKNQLKL